MNPANPSTLQLLPSKIQNKFFPADTPFVRYGTHGDGTCFFHSVCAARNEHGYLTVPHQEQQRIGREYRCRFSKHITDGIWGEYARKNNVDLTAEQARRKFCNSRTWANQAMIQFVAQVMHLNLLFIDSDGENIYCGVHGDPSEPMIVIMWVQRSHFEPVGVVRGMKTGQTAVQFVFDPQEDASIVNHILGAYKGECAA